MLLCVLQAKFPCFLLSFFSSTSIDIIFHSHEWLVSFSIFRILFNPRKKTATVSIPVIEVGVREVFLLLRRSLLLLLLHSLWIVHVLHEIAWEAWRALLAKTRRCHYGLRTTIERSLANFSWTDVAPSNETTCASSQSCNIPRRWRAKIRLTEHHSFNWGCKLEWAQEI